MFSWRIQGIYWCGFPLPHGCLSSAGLHFVRVWRHLATVFVLVPKLYKQQEDQTLSKQANKFGISKQDNHVGVCRGWYPWIHTPHPFPVWVTPYRKCNTHTRTLVKFCTLISCSWFCTFLWSDDPVKSIYQMQPNHAKLNMFHFLPNVIGQAFNLSVCQEALPHLSITAMPVLKQKSIGGNSSCQIVFKNVGRQLIPVITSEWKQNNVVTSLNSKKLCYRYMIKFSVGICLLPGYSWGTEIRPCIFFIWWVDRDISCATFSVR